MSAEILHAGFDGLKFTIQADIPPSFRAKLAEAKAHAVKTNADCTLEIGGVSLAVRRSGGSAFSAHTGEYGAEWYFLDPENRPPNNPGITVDFRAFLLATGGLAAAQEHFETCMEAFGILYAETQLRVSRVDFAVDILAPWFEPGREALVMPAGTRIGEYTSIDETETQSIGARVTGLRAGAVANRQLAIYDKRAEIIAKHKLGWLEIWNTTRLQNHLRPLCLKDANQSRVWRFEMRQGSKQLRNRWQMRSWADLHAKIGDSFAEFTTRIRYTIPQFDSNRARWPVHELWHLVTEAAAQSLAPMRSGAKPQSVKEANRAAHIEMLEGQLLGLATSLAAAKGIPDTRFPYFLKTLSHTLAVRSKAHPVEIVVRLTKAIERIRFK